MKRPDQASLRAARLNLARGKRVATVVAETVPEAVGAKELLGRDRNLRAIAAGFGPELQNLLDQPDITDILINGTAGAWIDRGNGLERAPQLAKILQTEADVRALAVRLAAAAGQRLDDASPIADGTFSGGLRLHAVLPPLGAEGALISLRTQRAITFSLAALSENGMVAPQLLPIVEALVARRANVMISGSTGSGKTTLLAALLSEVPETERILVIEEAAELRPHHPHVVHLQVRHANVQGVGEVSMSELVRAAMRMRPDRIVLGECRGPEVRDVLSALNTGHEGGWATIHANSALDVPARLTALGALAGMSEDVVAAQATSALDAVIHVERRHGMRMITQIGVFTRAGGELRAEPAILVEPAARAEPAAQAKPTAPAKPTALVEPAAQAKPAAPAPPRLRFCAGWKKLGPRLGFAGSSPSNFPENPPSNSLGYFPSNYPGNPPGSSPGSRRPAAP
ncbi:pilus assembly protein CpaF [Actinobaculum suis]|uniref:Pilus assembly protein CpaF n=1 Tax=Actinobaculum suis TaxID=1657 RepID=A0A1G7CR60_9ACTO|nr:TadA family conjugal transfer-associated ATPase [Actinobaculum suis]MDY5152474.1 TadA family conjugal transfer-associated ATPase [Actinobaculum suis]SDE41711.1 pilus assembly protein CpaF [Actinobaculum suis]